MAVTDDGLTDGQPKYKLNQEKYPEIPRGRIPPEQQIFECAHGGVALKKFERLVSKHPGVNLNWKNCYGLTALHAACGSGFAPMVKRLLELGADPNVPATDEYLTPLDFAVGAIELCGQFITDVTAWETVMRGPPAVYFKPETPKFEECKKILLAAGALRGYQVPEDGFVLNQSNESLRAYVPGKTYTDASLLEAGDIIEVGAEVEVAADAAKENAEKLQKAEERKKKQAAAKKAARKAANVA